MSLWAAENYALQQAMAVQSLLERLRPSLAVLGDPRRPTGMAALVDAEQGLFLAHRDAVQGDTIQARIGEDLFRLRVLSRDTRTDLVLLGQGSRTARYGTALTLADNEPSPGTRVVVLLTEGSLVGSFIGGQKLTLVGERKQAVPGSEIRFETPLQLVSGALLLSTEGKLVGTMGATIAQPGFAAKIRLRTLDEIKRAVASSQNSKANGAYPLSQNILPGGLTVAFTPNLAMMRRTVSGFLSEGHRAEYAALGIQVADYAAGGAVVMRVIPETPAGKAGVRVGDILLAIGSQPVNKQFDFIQALLAFRPGEKTTLRLRHDGTERQIEVTLARSKA